MANPSPAEFLAIFREFASLEKRRCSSGVTPLEFFRWSDLKKRLGSRFGQRGVGKSPESRPTRLRIDFETPEDFAESGLRGLASGEGMFISTPFAVQVGRGFVACVRIASSSISPAR